MPFTQNVLAMTDLLQFERVLPCVIIDKYQDWEFRQRFQYEALKGLIAEDFLSIKDFIWTADTCWTNIPWVSICRPAVPQNPNLRLTGLAYLPGMGWIGRTLAKLALLGFTKIFTDALTILKDKVKFPE